MFESLQTQSRVLERVEERILQETPCHGQTSFSRSPRETACRGHERLSCSVTHLLTMWEIGSRRERDR